MSVNKRMWIGAGSANHLTSHAQRFNECDRQVRPTEGVGGRQSNDTGADNSDIRSKLFRENWIRCSRCRRSPATIGPAGDIRRDFHSEKSKKRMHSKAHAPRMDYTRPEWIRCHAYQCVVVVARNRQNQPRPPSPLRPVVTRRVLNPTLDSGSGPERRTA